MSRIVPAFGYLFFGERPRWALWLPVCFGAGIALYFMLGSEPPWWTGPAAAALDPDVYSGKIGEFYVAP